MNSTCKTRLIVWGWAVSFIAVSAAPATMEAGINSGSLIQFLMGLGLIVIFGVASYLMHKNRTDCLAYADKVDEDFIRFLKWF